MNYLSENSYFSFQAFTYDELVSCLEDFSAVLLSNAANNAEVNVKDYNDYEVDKDSILNSF